MPRYIDADVYVEEMLKIIDKFTETDKTLAGFAKSIIQGSVPMFPTADVEPVVRGKWVDGHCNVCGCYGTPTFEGDNERTPFCPNCGAQMDEAVLAEKGAK